MPASNNPDRTTFPVERASLAAAAAVIDQGGIVAYPTEACYGLGCDPRHLSAVRRLLHLKRRSPDLGLIIIAAHRHALSKYMLPLEESRMRRIEATWPGPVTWLLPAHPSVSPWVRGAHDTVALRVTAHPTAAALCRHARRALISTSANRHGRPPARSAAEVIRQFGDAIDYVLSGRLGGSRAPTEIRDARTDAIIRAA
jgi:L-threonylcarbamoyladenylate synthase